MINVINERLDTEFSSTVSKFEITKITVMENDKQIQELENSIQELQAIIAPIYTSGISIKKYKKELAYLYSLAASHKRENRKTFYCVENLMHFLQELEKNEEIMQEATNYTNNKA